MALMALPKLLHLLHLASEHLYEVTGAVRFIQLIFDHAIPRSPTRTC